MRGRGATGGWRPLSLDLAVSNRRYRAITKTSRATAVRDLGGLAELGLVVPYGEARAASYRVDLDRFLPEGFRERVLQGATPARITS